MVPRSRRLYFVGPSNSGPVRPVLMAADVTTEPDFRVERVQTLIDP